MHNRSTSSADLERHRQLIAVDKHLESHLAKESELGIAGFGIILRSASDAL